jgi:hypothetical protein
VVGLDQPIGFGVTAFTVEDAILLLNEMGYDRYLLEAEKVEWIEIIEYWHLNSRIRWLIEVSSGPLYFRGIWSGFLNVGFGASGQRRAQD